MLNEFDRWFGDKGDETLRLDYLITSEDIVLDIGSHNGTWAEKIYLRYGCYIECYEPVEHLFEQCRSRLSSYSKALVFKKAVANAETIEIHVPFDDDASSAYINRGSKVERVECISPSDVISGRNISLMKINIEGGEFDLLDSMLEQDLLKNIVNLQVQFHSFVPDAETRRANIRERLSKTHKLTYDYAFVWENWKRSSDD